MFSLNMLIDGMSEFRIASEPDRHLFFDLLLICPPSREEEHMLEPADEPKARATKSPQPTRFTEFDETAESGSGTTLFVGGPSESLSFLEANADAYACILQNEAEPFSDNHRELMSRCYVLIASDPFPSALLKIQQAHNRIQLWQDRMKTELIHHESYQRLLDCSESMLSNFVSITDYSFQLLAFTKTIEPRNHRNLQAQQPLQNMGEGKWPKNSREPFNDGHRERILHIPSERRLFHPHRNEVQQEA